MVIRVSLGRRHVDVHPSHPVSGASRSPSSSQLVWPPHSYEAIQESVFLHAFGTPPLHISQPSDTKSESPSRSAPPRLQKRARTLEPLGSPLPSTVSSPSPPKAALLLLSEAFSPFSPAVFHCALVLMTGPPKCGGHGLFFLNF